jgi:hypothetical protein
MSKMETDRRIPRKLVKQAKSSLADLQRRVRRSSTEFFLTSKIYRYNEVEGKSRTLVRKVFAVTVALNRYFRKFARERESKPADDYADDWFIPELIPGLAVAQEVTYEQIGRLIDYAIAENRDLAKIATDGSLIHNLWKQLRELEFAAHIRLSLRDPIRDDPLRDFMVCTVIDQILEDEAASIAALSFEIPKNGTGWPTYQHKNIAFKFREEMRARQEFFKKYRELLEENVTPYRSNENSIYHLALEQAENKLLPET